jgi:hypothetical protein
LRGQSALRAAIALSVGAVLAVAGVAGAATATKSKVTIKAQSSGFFGYVSSPKASKCANGRKVTLYRQKGSKQKPATDRKVGSDTAQANGSRYMWSINTDQSGKFYARVVAKAGCKAASSKTVKSEEGSGESEEGSGES